MHRYEGSCSCGNVALSLSLPDELAAFAPRACDCDYCTSRAAAWLSHPEGALQLTIGDPLRVEKQGSGQASMQYCSQCDSLVAVTRAFGARLKGAVNSSMLQDKAQLRPAETVSPKLLNPEEKRARWSKLWLVVSIQSRSGEA